MPGTCMRLVGGFPAGGFPTQLIFEKKSPTFLKFCLRGKKSLLQLQRWSALYQKGSSSPMRLQQLSFLIAKRCAWLFPSEALYGLIFQGPKVKWSRTLLIVDFLAVQRSLDPLIGLPNWLNFDPGHKRFYMGHISDYPLTCTPYSNRTREQNINPPSTNNLRVHRPLSVKRVVSCDCGRSYGYCAYQSDRCN